MLELRGWTADDAWLLERQNTPEMTAYLGGPESPEKLADRQERYVGRNDPGGMLVVESDGEVVGSIGYWEHAEPEAETDVVVWETGWAILPEFQGRGLATQALAAVIERAAAEHTHDTLHAYPSVKNLASNALCRKGGFTLLGPRQFEYPKGHWMTCNDWSYRLF